MKTPVSRIDTDEDPDVTVGQIVLSDCSLTITGTTPEGQRVTMEIGNLATDGQSNFLGLLACSGYDPVAPLQPPPPPRYRLLIDALMQSYGDDGTVYTLYADGETLQHTHTAREG